MEDHHHHHQMDDGHPKIIVGMDHSNHDDALPSTDHSSHISPAMDHMMMMYFHGGYNEVILFDIWRISTVGGLIGSMIGCFLLGILYEAIKSYREHWMRGAFQTINISQNGRSKSPVVAEQGRAADDAREAGDQQASSSQSSVKFIETNMWSLAHFVLTMLHLVQVTLAYFLMLIVMTYNSWLCGSIILGAAVGYFLFGWRKASIVDVSDHCH